MYPDRKCVNKCVDDGNSDPSQFTVTVCFYVTQSAETQSNNELNLFKGFISYLIVLFKKNLLPQTVIIISNNSFSHFTNYIIVAFTLVPSGSYLLSTPHTQFMFLR